MEDIESAIAFQCPALHCVVGNSMCGKTFYTKKLCLNAKHLFAEPVEKIYYCYEIYQTSFEELESSGVIFHKGCPTKNLIEQWGDECIQHKLLILDDLMSDVTNSLDILKLFTIYAHHLKFSVLFLKQTIFDTGRHGRSLSLNTQIYHLFENSRDQLNVQNLLRQMFPITYKKVMDAYKQATSIPFRPLVISLHPKRNKEFQLSTDIFHQHPIIYKLE